METRNALSKPMSRQKKQKPACAFCGNPAKTKDHIPPKGLFAEPRPNNLITVPACERCNSNSKKDDEYLQRLSLVERAEQSADARQIQDKIFRAIDRPQAGGVRTGFLRAVRPVELYSPAGTVFLGRRFKIEWDKERVIRACEKIVKGLFYRVTKRRLPDGYMAWAETIGRKTPPEEMIRNESKILKLPGFKIGERAFVYRYFISDKYPNLSVWRFNFYGAHTFMGYTMKVQGDDLQMISIEDPPNPTS